MKKRIISAVSAMACAIMMLAATPAAVSAAEAKFTGATNYISGATNVEKGSTTAYNLVCVENYDDGSVKEYSVSLNVPGDTSWSVVSSVSADTTFSVINGFGVLQVADDETAGVIVIQAYDVFYKNTSKIYVYVSGNEANIPASSSAPSDADPFWLGVHSSLSKGAKTVTVNADGYTFIPFYVLDALRGKNATLTVTCGLDNYVINGKNMKNLREGASYSFGNLADILNVKTEPNSRGGVTYSTQK